MNKLIVYPLMILLIVGAFYQLVNVGSADFTYNETLAIDTVYGNQTINGSETEYTQNIDSGTFDVDMTTGLVVLIIGLVVIGVVAGIKVLGSGLDSFSVKLIYKATTYFGLWSMFSVFSIGFFTAIPYFGLLFWFGLTTVFSLGFFQTLED